MEALRPIPAPRPLGPCNRAEPEKGSLEPRKAGIFSIGGEKIENFSSFYLRPT
jgi:hypothetical protein